MPNSASIQTVLENVLDYSRERNYIGWDKHDGMSSQIRKTLWFEHKWTNLAFQEVIKRAPINLRPLFLVEQRPSPKALSLFVMANLNAYDITGEERYRHEARELCERICSHSLDRYGGFCLYHNHDIQGISRKTPVGTPGVVGTSYGVKALLRGADLNEKYAKIARTAVNYVEGELNPHHHGGGIRVSYKPTEDTQKYTLNANALAARLYVDLYDYFGDDEFKEMATGILNYVSDQQDQVGGWKYTDPPSASRLSIDNYHNGFIIESFLRYQQAIDPNRFVDTLRDSLNFYRESLFEADGAPCWDESKAFPRDVHAAAQGIVVFSYAGDIEFARQIVTWTIDNLHAGNGQFYYQKRKFYLKRFTLMRWCQAWMAYALGEHLISAD